MVAPPTHFVSIYDNPLSTLGNGRRFQARYQAYNYRHSIASIGGFDSMSCDLAVDRYTAELVYANFLGSRIAAFVDNPNFIWEGFINRITYRPGNKEFTRSFDDMANRVRVVYNLTSAGTVTGVSTIANNTTSQGLYGVKDAVYETDINYGADVTHKDDVRTLKLAQNAYPQVSSKESGGGAILSIECLGFYWLWDWEVYNSTSTTSRTASAQLRRLVGDTTLAVLPANASKIYQTGATGGAWGDRITTNAAFNYNDESTSGRTFLETIQGIPEAGDGSARWVLGITPLDHLNSSSGALRYVYYRPAQTSALYTAKALTEPGIIRDNFGRLVDPWRVQPDNIVRITDVLAGYSNPGEDPRQTYITNVNYDAETLTAAYQGEDDITMAGAMGLKQRYPKHGKRLKDAKIRVII